jgi:hypothetical protein
MQPQETTFGAGFGAEAGADSSPFRPLPLLEIPGPYGPCRGIYAECEALVGTAHTDLLRRLQEAPEVPPAAHFDGPRAFAAIDRLLRAAGRDV